MRPDVVGAELVGAAEAELEELNGHEGQEHQAGDGQAQDVDALSLHQSLLPAPGSLQAHEDMEQHRQEDVLLHDFGTARQTQVVVGDLEALHREDGRAHFLSSAHNPFASMG